MRLSIDRHGGTFRPSGCECALYFGGSHVHIMDPSRTVTTSSGIVGSNRTESDRSLRFRQRGHICCQPSIHPMNRTVTPSNLISTFASRCQSILYTSGGRAPLWLRSLETPLLSYRRNPCQRSCSGYRTPTGRSKAPPSPPNVVSSFHPFHHAFRFS
jgi:hypothetical protein